MRPATVSMSTDICSVYRDGRCSQMSSPTASKTMAGSMSGGGRRSQVSRPTASKTTTDSSSGGGRRNQIPKASKATTDSSSGGGRRNQIPTASKTTTDSMSRGGRRSDVYSHRVRCAIAVSSLVPKSSARIATLTSLPPELLHQIFTYGFTTAQLIVVCRVCRLLRKVASDPFVWRQAECVIERDTDYRGRSCSSQWMRNVTAIRAEPAVHARLVYKVLDECGRHNMLRKLSLRYVKCAKDSFVEIIAAQCPLLTELDVAGCRQLTERAIVSLQKLLRPSTLEMLDVSDTLCVGRARPLARFLVTHCEKLRVLALRRARTDELDLVVWAVILHALSLTSLDLEGCRSMNGDLLSRFASQRRRHVLTVNVRDCPDICINDVQRYPGDWLHIRHNALLWDKSEQSLKDYIALITQDDLYS
ncbi:hypothetical protein DFJ77DRAFT_27432 [Powellomyces hirtus]|nr:hypothetical protein DFJ77DRAFT_27432 [Powellomyces hirtus]